VAPAHLLSQLLITVNGGYSAFPRRFDRQGPLSVRRGVVLKCKDFAEEEA